MNVPIILDPTGVNCWAWPPPTSSQPSQQNISRLVGASAICHATTKGRSTKPLRPSNEYEPEPNMQTYFALSARLNLAVQ